MAAARDGRRAGAELVGAVRRRRRAGRRGRGHRLPGVRQGGRRRRRARHAPGRGAGRAARVDRGARCARPSRRSATPRCSWSRPSSTPGTSRCRSSPTRQGNVVHLYERDCSVQRRHQKVDRDRPGAEPGPGAAGRGSAPTRCASPGTSATSTPAPSSSCSTRDGQHVFIEMNPRIQVEHTVTEEVTDVDLVSAAAAHRGRRDAGRPGPAQDDDHPARRRAAVPDHHRGPGQRLPPGHRRRSAPTARPAAPASGSTAAPPTPVPRSARTSTRCWSSSPAAARDFDTAVRRARRALAEFRIRGVSTNIPFLQPRCSTTRTSRPAASRRRSSRSARTCSPRASPPTAAPGCSPTSPTSR